MTPNANDRDRLGSLKILYVIAYPRRMNGAQKSLMLMVKAIMGKGVSPVAAFTSAGICETIFDSNGIPTQLMDLPSAAHVYGKKWLGGGVISRARRLLREYPGIVIGAWRFVSKSNADVVHCNEPRALLIAGLAARLQRRKVVLHMRGSIDPYGPLLRRVILLIPHRIIVVGPSIAEEMPMIGRRKSRVIYNPVPIPEVKPTQIDRSQQQVRKVLVMASLVPHKGHHHLIEAAALIEQQDRPYVVRIDVLGQTIDDEYAQMLDSRIAELGVKSVSFHGWQRDVGPFLDDADLLVSASVDHERLTIGDREIEVANAEGTPRQLLEALASTTPVVATRIPGVADIVEHNVTGLLVEPRDPGRLAEAILELLDNPKQARKLAEAGRNAVAGRHLPDRSATQVAQVYAELLDPAGR